LINKYIAASILLVAGFTGLSHAQEEQPACLNGFDLTAIVVLENDIRQSVESYACRMAFPDDSSTYDLYNQLRDKWSRQRTSQRELRNQVYQRIYGDVWQEKVDSWRQSMAITYSDTFKPTDIACQDLRMELLTHAHDWKTLYKASAREAASAKYDALRCKAESVISISQ
jgi:hypothetical protein